MTQTTQQITDPGKGRVGCISFTFDINTPDIANGVWFGSIPVGAKVLRTSVFVETVFNAGTTNVVTVGTTKASANELAGNADVDETAVGMNSGAVANQGNVNTGAATDGNGGVGLYAKFAQTGTAATAGNATAFVEFTNGADGAA